MNRILIKKNLTSDKPFFNIGMRQFLAFLFTFILAVAASYRVFGIDSDFYQYMFFYQEIFNGRETGKEALFEYLAKSVQFVFGQNSLTTFFFVIAFISLFFKLKILSFRDDYLLLILIYILLLYPLHEMTQLRVSLSLGFAYWGLYTATHLNAIFLLRLAFTSIAIGFHLSAILLAPFILFPYFFQKRSLIYAILAITLPAVVTLYGLQVIESLVPGFDVILRLSKEEEIPNLLSTRFVTYILLLSMGLFLIRDIPRKTLPWFYISLLGMGIFLGSMSIPVVANRILELTIFSYLFWIIDFPKQYKFIAIFLLLTFSFYSFIKNIYLSPIFYNDCVGRCFY
jgi:hypothetical protein